MPLLWQIDDTPRWHDVTRRTLAALPQWSSCHHLTGEAAIAAWVTIGPDARPDVVLMDYYLGSMTGVQVTRALRAAETGPRRSHIIGHSTVAERSAEIVASGGDVVVRKHGDPPAGNPSLREYLQAWISAGKG